MMRARGAFARQKETPDGSMQERRETRSDRMRRSCAVRSTVESGVGDGRWFDCERRGGRLLVVVVVEGNGTAGGSGAVDGRPGGEGLF